MSKPPRVLIIEDEAVIRDLLAEFLAGQGYEVELTSSGEDGLVAARAKAFDIVLADYGLPGMNGIDACRKISSIDSRSQCVLMTGWGNMEAAEREPCINRVIPKPFDLMAVLTALQELAPVV